MNELSTEEQKRAAQTLSLTGATILALAVIAAGYYVSFWWPRGEAEVRKFTGDVVGIERETVTLYGIFDGPPGAVPDDLSAARDFSFQVDETTRFEEAGIRWPTWEELAAQGTSGTFNIEDLPKAKRAGSLDDLKNLHASNPGRVYVEAGFSASILGSGIPTASFVFYQTIGIPPPSPQTIQAP